MRRGEIWLVDLEPVLGTEANKVRPAVLVGNDFAIAQAEELARGVVTVVPITSNVERVWAFQVLLPGPAVGLDRDSKAQAEQVRSVDVRRLVRRLGWLTPGLLWELDEALRLHLDLR